MGGGGGEESLSEHLMMSARILGEGSQGTDMYDFFLNTMIHRHHKNQTKINITGINLL